MTDKLSDIQFSYKTFDGVYDATKQTDPFYPTTDFLKHVTKDVWSPILFKNHYRDGDNFISAQWGIIDFDDTDIPIEQAAKNFIDYRYVIAATKSHNPPFANYYRVCIPFEKPITDVDQFRENQSYIIGSFKENKADPTTKDAGRMYWPFKFIFAVNEFGDDLEVRPKEDVNLRKFIQPYKLGYIPPWLNRKLDKTIPLGERHNTIFAMACALRRHGYGADHIEGIYDERLKFEGTISKKEIRRSIENACKKVEEELRTD